MALEPLKKKVAAAASFRPVAYLYTRKFEIVFYIYIIHAAVYDIKYSGRLNLLRKEIFPSGIEKERTDVVIHDRVWSKQKKL